MTAMGKVWQKNHCYLTISGEGDDLLSIEKHTVVCPARRRSRFPPRLTYTFGINSLVTWHRYNYEPWSL